MENIKIVANNKKAYHDYFIEDKYEAGISLAGTEVKSLRQGKCSIKESFVRIEKGEVFIYGMHVSPYEKGYTLIPIRVYFKGSLVKVEVGLAKGKKLYDKRHDIAKRDQNRDIERHLKN